MLDACNALWRNRTFVDHATDSTSCQAVQVEAELSCLRLPKTALDALHTQLRNSPAPCADTTRELRRTLSITHGMPWQGLAREFLQLESTIKIARSNGTLPGTELTLRDLEGPSLKAAYLEFLRDKVRLPCPALHGLSLVGLMSSTLAVHAVPQGFVGLHAFLHAFISSLAKRKAGKGEDAKK